MSEKLFLKEIPDNVDKIIQNESEDSDEISYKKKRRNMRFSEETWLHYARCFFLVVSVISTAGVVIIYSWHLVGPRQWRWLSADDLANLKGLAITIVTGLILSQTTAYAFKNKQ